MEGTDQVVTVPLKIHPYILDEMNSVVCSLRFLAVSDFEHTSQYCVRSVIQNFQTLPPLPEHSHTSVVILTSILVLIRKTSSDYNLGI